MGINYALKTKIKQLIKNNIAKSKPVQNLSKRTLNLGDKFQSYINKGGDFLKNLSPAKFMSKKFLQAGKFAKGMINDPSKTMADLGDNILNKVEVPDTKCFAYILSTVDAIKISDIVYNKYDKHVKLNKSDKTAILDDIDKTVVGTWVTHSKSGFIVLISEYDFEENSILEKEDYICAEA